ncbi:MAG: hypothetical protein O7B79_09810, partial [SAR324 cluster bacterium]|nr:hypothetical protein [SAR324 cluster bacterium]
ACWPRKYPECSPPGWNVMPKRTERGAQLPGVPPPQVAWRERTISGRTARMMWNFRQFLQDQMPWNFWAELLDSTGNFRLIQADHEVIASFDVRRLAPAFSGSPALPVILRSLTFAALGNHAMLSIHGRTEP